LGERVVVFLTAITKFDLFSKRWELAIKTENKSMGSEVVYLSYLGSAALVAPKK